MGTIIDRSGSRLKEGNKCAQTFKAGKKWNLDLNLGTSRALSSATNNIITTKAFVGGRRSKMAAADAELSSSPEQTQIHRHIESSCS